MAVTKILPRNGGLKEAIDYVLNGDKTDGHILTAHFNCDPGREYREMMKTKLETGRLDKRQCYHIIQSFKPGEITPELALEIAKAFAQEHLDGFEVVIGTHVDRHHIHSHIVFNSVNADTGEKYHSTQQSYYQQIRAISDRLCREHGLSVIVQGEPARSVSYIEWLRQSKGQPTFRSMLEADLRDAIRDANDLGHFFLLMEHKGYEIHHGGRLGFRLRGQDRYQYPGRQDPLFTEDGIRTAIQGNLEQIEAGLRPVLPVRPAYQPYRKHPRYSGFLALYVHYLYLLGKIGKRQYPPRMTPHLRQAVMRFERYQAQFAFLRKNDILLCLLKGGGGVKEDGRAGHIPPAAFEYQIVRILYGAVRFCLQEDRAVVERNGFGRIQNWRKEVVRHFIEKRDRPDRRLCRRIVSQKLRYGMFALRMECVGVAGA
mgnify:CR=1 FL=1